MDLEARAQLDPVRRIPAENKRFLALFRRWSPTDWSKPTRCPDWTAAHLAAHLIVNALFLAEITRDSLAGDGKTESELGPPFGFPDLPTYRKWRAEERERCLRGGPERAIDAFEHSAAHIQEWLPRINPANSDQPVWHPAGGCKLGYVPTFRYRELLYHHWDIRAADDPSARLGPEGIPVLADRLPMILGHACRRRPTDQPGGRVRIDVTDPARNFLLEWRGADTRALVDDGGPADATFKGKADALLLLVAGRADRKGCEAEGSFGIEGDRALGDALVEVLFRPF
ncbi:MAG: maleylpyruvate isomerase family mycothiol-dependent enzyme [Nitrospinota bacterium]